MNGATLYETGEVLGHRSVQTTKRYAHLSIEHKRNLTDRVFGDIDHG
jgi:site-specific recombinase XerD